MFSYYLCVCVSVRAVTFECLDIDRAVKCVNFMFWAGRDAANNSLARDRQWKGFISGKRIIQQT